MRYYGIVLDMDLFTPEGDDKTWTFTRLDQDGNTTTHDGINTSRDLSEDSSIVLKENMRQWINEFLPNLNATFQS
jgi:hypothetical protein